MWYVTWRHNDQTPMECRTYPVKNEEKGVVKQRRLLNAHEEFSCFYCSRIAGKPDPIKGNNNNIVTRVRTEEAVYKTIYKYIP